MKPALLRLSRRCWSFLAVATLACHESPPGSPSMGTGGAGSAGSAPGAGAPGTGGGSTAAVDGYARNPIVSHIFTADPSAHVFDGRVYVYASHDPDQQAAYEMNDYHVFSSDDLVNWRDHGVVLSSADTWAKYLYAPDCCYSQKQGKYYLYFPDSGSGIGVAVADGPAGPFQDALGKPLIDSQLPGVADVDWIFDPTCFIDDDGQAYLYFGGGQPNTGDNARVVRLNDDMISLRDTSATTIVAPDFFEAPYAHKYRGKYYFSYSTTYAQHAPAIDYMVSDQPMTGFQYAGTVLPNPEDDEGDNNHHSLLEYEGRWYIFYHSRTLALRDGFSKYQRSILLDYLSYDPQGNIVQVPARAGRVAQLRAVDARARIEAESMADQRGIETAFAVEAGARVGVAVTDIHDQDWIGYSQLDFGDGVSGFKARIAAADGPSTIEISIDGCPAFNGAAGTWLGSCEVPATGGTEAWVDVQCGTQRTSGVHDLCLRFTAARAGPLFDFDYFEFD